MLARGHGHFVDVRLLLWKRPERAEGRATGVCEQQGVTFCVTARFR